MKYTTLPHTNIKISKINDDVPLFVKNYYTDKQQEIPKEFLNKK